ncbi:ESPR-type extended signal peptide-containing protein [Hymenobacter algoricola]|uniref:ESPR-type extended signal peptide-containing protein n=1 Tax=Hymenobacter algoricola TaxID=486267 RepID=A0ABP7NLS6_9BACT
MPAAPIPGGTRLRRLGLLLALLLSSQLSWAQVTKTLPGDYATLAAAFTDLNTSGVPAGGVVINVTAGYAETLTAPLLLTATGTATNAIVFQKAGAGANPKITAGVGTTTSLDAIIGLSGADYVTFDGLELTESAANTTPITQMEFGFALFRPSPTDGCQFNTIRNCVVTLNKANTGTFGLYGAATTAALATSVAATAPAGANSGNRIYGNTVSNAVSGMYLTGATTTTAPNYDLNNEIGVTAANTVTNFGGLAASGWGIGVNIQNGARIANNIVNSGGGAAGTSTLRGIYGNTGTSSNIDITNNTITLSSGATTSLLAGIDNGIGSTAAANTVNITGNTVQLTYATATTGTLSGISNTASAATVNITGNTVQNSTAAAATTASFNGIVCSAGAAVNLSSNNVTNNSTAGTGTMTLISSSIVSAATPVTINNNTLSGNSKTPAGTTAGTSLFGISLGTATTTITGNTVTNNSIVSSGTSTSTCTLTGINSTAASTPTEVLSNNVVTGLTISGTSTSTSHLLRGIVTATSSSNVQTMTQNTVAGLALTAGSGTVTGIAIPSGGGAGSSIARNKIYDLSAAGATSTVNGLTIAGGGTFALTNNLIGDLRAPAATGLVAISGMSFTSATAVNAYFNTIYLNATSAGATFGTSGIYLNSTATTLDARNNLVVNKSTAAGTGGYTAALRRVSGTAGTAPANLAAATNNNLYYAGTPSATNVIYVEGTSTATNAAATLAGYKALVFPRETNSATEDVSFLSTTGPDATFLHINPAPATQVESGGTPVSGVTIDFDGQTRNATTPDIGADEGSFTPLDLTAPTITLTPLGNTPSTANRTLTVTITDPSGIATGADAPRLFFRKGTTGAFQSVQASSVSGSAYTFTFDYSLVGGVTSFDAIQYYVVAQDASANNNVSSNPPGGTFTTLPAQVYQFLIQGTLSGTYYVGTGASPDATRTYATLTAAAAAYNNNLLGGAVTFLLLDASYGPNETFPIQLLANADASAVNTLTIKPTDGLNTTLTGSNAVALLQLIGTDYVTVDGTSGGTLSASDLRPSRNWTLNNTSTATASNGIVLTVFNAGGDNATNNTFRNLVITGSGAATAQAGIIMLAAAANPAGNNGNVVRNNAVSGSIYGIYSQGPSAAVKNTGTVISQNDLTVTGAGAIGRFGITGYFEDGIQVTQNTVDGINTAVSGDAWGIGLGFTGISGTVFTGSEVVNATVDRNYIGTVRQTNTFSAVGIALAAATSGTSTISNNMIAGVSANGTSGDFGAGIYLGGGTGSTTRVVFNSISMTGTQTGGNYPSYALAVGGSSPAVQIRNNVLANTQTTGTANSIALGFAYSSTAGAYANLTSSNNSFFIGTGANFGVGQTGSLSTTGTLRATLAALNAETGQDNPATSKVADPQFVSATDLHSVSPALNNAGVPVADITVDFDGQLRSGLMPDIGADEFSLLDLATTALTGPTAGNGCYSATEAVSVTIRNTTAVTLDFAVTPATVFVSVAGGAAAQNISTIVNTGTLAPGASLVVAVGTVDLSAAATYSLSGAVSITGDEVLENNTLATPLTIVSTPRTVAFTYAAGTICAGSGSAVTPTLGSGSVTGGTFSAPAGLTIDPTTGAINPTTSTAGTYLVSYTVAAAGNCPALTATQSVTVAPVASAAFSYAAASFCRNGANPSPTVTGVSGGTFAGSTGLSIDPTTGVINLSATAAGTYTVTYTAGGSCPGTTTQSVTITSAPVAAFSYAAGTYCAGATSTVPPTLGSGAAAGTFSSTAGLSLDPATGVINVAASTAGTYTVTNTIAASGSCAGVTATASVTITPATSAAFAYAGSTFCLSGTNPTPTITGTAGGTFSSTTGLSLNAGTGVITLATSTPGMYTVTYSVSGPCASSTTTQVTITTAPSASFSYAQPGYCAGGTATVTPTFGANSSGGVFSVSPATGLTIAPNTGVVTLASSAAGTYTVTNTIAASGGCAAATASTTIILNAAPAATLTAGGPTTFCQGGSVTFTAPAGTGNSYQFLLNGTAINGATSATYTASAAGSYSVTVTNASACSATSAATAVVVNPTTTATFTYASPAFCLSGTNPAPTITGTAGGTFSAAAGLSLNAATGVINLATSTAGTYVVTYSVGGSCPSSAIASITLNPAAIANAGANQAFCSGSSVQLGTTAIAGYTYSWSPATGLSSATVSNPTVTLTNTGTAPLVVTYTLTATTANGCSSTSTVQVTVNPGPVTATLTAGGPTTFCQGGSVTFTATATTGNSYQYFLNGTAIAGATNPTFTAVAAGSYTVQLTNTTNCFTVSAPVVVTVNATPNTPTLTSTTQPSGAILLTSSAATGNQFYRNGVLVPGATGQTLLLLSGAQSGIYTVVSTSGGGCSSAASNAVNATVLASAKANLAAVSALLFPNPTADGNVMVELRGYSKAADVTVLNTLGQVVRTLVLHPEQAAASAASLSPVDLSTLPVGVYLLRISSPNTAPQLLKLVRR